MHILTLLSLIGPLLLLVSALPVPSPKPQFGAVMRLFSKGIIQAVKKTGKEAVKEEKGQQAGAGGHGAVADAMYSKYAKGIGSVGSDPSSGRGTCPNCTEKFIADQLAKKKADIASGKRKPDDPNVQVNGLHGKETMNKQALQGKIAAAMRGARGGH